MRLLLFERLRPAGDLERGLSAWVTDIVGIGSSRFAMDDVLSAMACVSKVAENDCAHVCSAMQ
jgi:hypothetical protein